MLQRSTNKFSFFFFIFVVVQLDRSRVSSLQYLCTRAKKSAGVDSYNYHGLKVQRTWDEHKWWHTELCFEVQFYIFIHTQMFFFSYISCWVINTLPLEIPLLNIHICTYNHIALLMQSTLCNVKDIIESQLSGVVSSACFFSGLFQLVSLSQLSNWLF